MKFVILSIAVAVGLPNYIESSQGDLWPLRMLRVRQRKHQKEIKPTNCRLFERDGLIVQGTDARVDDEPEWFCENEYGHFYKIDGLNSDFFKINHIESGGTNLKADASNIQGDRIVIQPDAKIELIKDQSRRSLAPFSGVNSMLVMRVVSLDGQPTRSAQELSDDIFGTNSDRANMVSQFKACSGGKLQFVPAEGESIVNGVLEVRLSENLSGVRMTTAGNIVRDAAERIVGPLDQFTQLMTVLPTNVDFGHYAAIAYIGGIHAIFKDTYVSQLLPQVHEVGHNLGLHHSGRGQMTYGDNTCMMGVPSFADDKPLQCFNGAKSWYLGWYEDRHVTITPTINSWKGKLVGIDDYINGQTKEGEHFVIARIEDTTSDTDLYVMYNRKEGVNRDVVECGDEVTIVSGAINRESTQTWRLAALDVGDVFRGKYFSGQSYDLVVEMCSKVTGQPDHSEILVYLDNGINKPTCTVQNSDTILSPGVCPQASARSVQQSCEAHSECCTWNSDNDTCSGKPKCDIQSCYNLDKNQCRSNSKCCKWKKNKCGEKNKCRGGCPAVRDHRKSCIKDSSGCCEWKNKGCRTASRCQRKTIKLLEHDFSVR